MVSRGDPQKSMLGSQNGILARSKPTTKFAQPRSSRVKARSSPARGCKFGCVCSYMAGHDDAGVVTCIGTNTPFF